MTSVEKRRSGRKSGGHRRHSDGGYSDTSSGGSFLDENDREVSSLTDRAFRSLCIGDEAVYNDSDLSLSSPCTQKDRQLAFSQSGQDRDREYREREELKRAAHENFSLKVQQYGQDWIHGRRYGGEIHRDPRWEFSGERAQGRISATFQHSVVETSQQEKSLREELNFLSNGATELSSQQRRSRSRVSSLIRAFNSEGHRDGVGMEDKLREWSEETSWDKSALMSIQRELSEFSTSYQQNFHSGHFPSSGPFSCRDTNLYSSGSDIAAASHSSASSFMRSSQSMFTQVDCNSNVFIHSEFSPFKVWRDHNRFPFQQGQVSGFMHCSEFPKWYETPMYKEPSQMGQPQGYYTGIRQPRSNLAPMISPALPRSTSTMLQNASAVEKRCESELAGHYPHRKRTQSLGTNRLPSHRPSTASPTTEMSRRVRDTISSVKALQQKIKMMTEQNITRGVTENQQAVLCSSENLNLDTNAITVAPNIVSSNTSTTPFNVSQMLTPLVHAHPEAVSSDFQHYAVSPQPVEHPPVRAESRGATPDVRMSTYKSRATSLLFNLKDNRKRVKSTYSPTKFKAVETQEKNKQEPRETVIDIPYFPDSEIQFSQLEESSRTSAAINQYHCPELPLTVSNSQPVMTTTAYSLSDYQTAQMQGQMVHHSGFTGFLPENYIGNKLVNGQNLHEDLASFAPYKQDTMADAGTLGRDLYTHNPPYSATETPKLNADNNQSGGYLISKPNTEQPFNETVGRLFTKVEKCEQLKHNKHDYNNVSLQDKRRQINSQDTEKLGVKATLSPWKQETAALMEKTGQENQQTIDQEFEKEEMRESFAICPSDKKPGLVNTNISNQPLSNDDNEKTEMKDTYFKQNYNKHNDNEYISHQTFSSIKEKHIDTNETKKQYMQIPRGHEVHDLQPTEAKPQSEHNIHKNSFNPDNTSAPQMSKQMKDRQFVEVKPEPFIAEHIKSHHTQVEVAKVQQWAQVEQPEAESSRLILAGQSDSEKVTAEQAQAKAEHIKGEKIKGEQTRQFGEKQPELAREEETKAEQTRLHEARDEPRNITEKAGAEHIKKEQGKQVKAEQAEAEKLKEEHIKTELAKTEQAWQARIEEAKTEQATEKRINAAQIQEAQVTTEQVKKEQTEAEQSETEKVNAKQAEAEKTNTEQVQEQQTKEKVRTNAAEVEKVQTDHIKIENFQKAKEGKASAHVGQVNTDWSTAEISTMQNAKPKERKVEWAKQERAKAELIKAESMQEMSAKLTAKLTATQQVKIEPDKVEQVKTELAKAKAELAKIKEKMRGEQKEKVKHSVITKEDDTAKNNVPLKLNIHKNEDYLKQDKTVQMHQQKEDSVIRNGADDYERLREKYGFTNLILANRNNASATEDISLNDANETQVLSPDKAEIVKEKSIEEHSPTSRFTTANKEKIEEVGGFKSSEVSESQCVHSDSSKEFKLSNANYSPTSVNKRINGDTVRDKMKDNSVGKLEKCDPVKVTEVSQQRDSDLAKLLPHERKSKSAEHTVGPVKDQHFIPPRSLSHKERTMTKQEILTSKIKAHAEKEISAIKEKGCAIRDGFTSKGSFKQLAGSQTVNTRQRPPSQEVSKKHESSVPSNIKPKPQMEPSGVQVDLVKSVSPMNSKSNLQIPVKSSAITTHNIMSTAECLLLNQKQETKPMKNKEQPPTNDRGEQKADHTEISGKPKDGLKDYSAINTDNPNKKEEDPGHTTGVEATNSKPVTTGNTESKEADRVDLSPLLNVVFGQKKDPTADQSLQIKGIMVTVRERKPTVNTGQGNCSTQNQMNAIEKENNSSDLDKHPPNSGLELSERNISTNELTKTKDIEETEDQAKFIIKSHSENVQETPPSEAVTNNMRMCQKRTHPQQESSTMNIKPQGETQPETLTEKGDRVTVSAKNKVPGETQPLLYKENIIVRERKDHTDETLSENSASSLRTDEEKVAQNVQTAHTNENFSVTAVNTGIDNTNDAETLIKQVTQQTVKEDMTNVVNHSNISSVDGIRTTVLEENKHDSTTAKTLNTSPSNKATKNEKTNVSHKRQDNEKQISDANKEDDNLHIDNIAIQVVPPVTEDSLKKVGKQHGATLPYEAVQSNEEKQVASSSCKEKVKTLNTKEHTRTKKYSSEDTFGVQHVLSSVRKLSDSLKISSQQNSNNATSENMQSENEELEKVKKCGESNEQPAEGDYFQVQGITETSNEPQHNSITDRDASKGRELPGLPPNKTAVSNESHTEGKIEAFVFTLDQSKRKTVDSSTLRIQAEDAKRKAEAEDKLASKQRDGFRERWSSNENTEADQDNHIGKQMVKQSTLSATERQSSRNSRPARESTVQEKPEVKPKPKGKVSTIPEISAIADYARLKVIVSEDREETAFQEYPPNKKEGFFPLIQTRHSRRPVFTPDPQELSVKEKSLPNKTEMSAKVNKVPKAVVFPITDKEHQRTGMFKLGEKERQDAKVNEDPVVNATKYTHHKERNDSPKTQTVQMSDSQRVCQPNSHSLQAATSASVVKNSLLHPTMGQMHNRKENMTQQMQDERVEKQQDKDTEANTEDGRTDKLKEESLATQHDKIKVKQQIRKKQGGEEQALRCEEEKKDDMRIKHILEESRASLAEEERRAIQREEERRAREREAVAIKIKERRDKQRESERRTDEERKVKQKEEDIRAKQREEKMRMKEIEEKTNIEEQHRAAQEEQQRRAVQEEQQRRVVEEEQQKRAAQEEQHRRAAQEEKQRRTAQEEQQRRAAQEELQRKVAQEELQRRAVREEQQRRAVQEEQQRRAAEEQWKKAAQEEQQRRVAQEEQQRRAVQEEQQRRAAEEQWKKAAQEEQQRRATQEEQQRRAAQEEQQKRAAQEELQRKVAQEEQQRRAVREEQQRRAVQEEQQQRAAEEQQKKAAQEEQQRRATQEEHLKKAAQEEQQRRAAEEQWKKAAQEELQRRAAEEQQKKAAQEELQKRAAEKELQRRAVQEEQQRRAAQEEQQREAAQEEQQRKATQEELQRRAAQGELQRRATQEKQWRTAAQEEQRRRAAQEEQQKKAVHEEQHKLVKEEEQRKAEEQQRRAAQREVQMRVVQEIQQRRRAALIEEQRETEKILVNIEEEKNRKHREEDKVTHISEKERINQIQIEEKKRQKWKNEEWITQKGESGKRVVEKEKIIKEQNQVKERPKPLENSQEALKEEKRVAKDDDIQANKRKEEKLTVDSENVRDAEVEQKRAAQVDALQYYAITSTESEKKPRERQLCSPSPSQQRNNLSEHESPESHMRPSRPHAPASPASSLPRSNTSSPALGAKPLMFRVKDNTFRGSSSTKSVKPRFFKSFGDDFQMGSPSDRGSDRREEEQEKIRHSGGTPVHLDTGLNRLIAESSTSQSASSPQDHSTPIPHCRPYSRRSIAMDEDDSRSFISNMSEDVESFATSAADLAETRGLYDYERPESACSFSSDASRSLGKPPVVPPKSEKALRRAQRLTTRRMKKELSKVATDSPTGVGKDVSTIRSPSSTEVRSPSRHAMASPHFSSPISLANAPVLGSSLPSSHTEHQSSHYSFHASPHATGPISIPHSTAAVSLPAVSPYATGPASHAAAPKTVAHVPSSPTLHHPNHPAPVTQYHVESSYPQSYPLTQRKVLQDPGSGQYFVVDLPVQVKKKTFFDPQTGKYIQLNVRESGQSILQPQPQQTCPQPQLQPQMQIKPQQQPFSQTFPAGKPVLLYQGYHGYPQGYQPANINSLHPSRSQVPAALHQNQQPGYPGFELGQNSEGHRYSPEKTPYMDTVNDKAKTSNTVYSTHGSYESFPECDTNSQLARSSVCENDNSAHSQCCPRDIIAMSELEDFMEVSDW